MAWDGPALVNLADLLADLYPTREDSYRVVEGAGLARRLIRFNDAPALNWHAILTYAKNQNAVPAVVAFALREHPNHTLLSLASERGGIPSVKGPDIASVDWQGPRAGAGLEVILGSTSTLVDVSFLEVGLARARAVVRVKHSDGSTGSGFFEQSGLLVTNNHVIPDEQTARSSVVECNYQRTAAGLDAPVEVCRLAPQAFFFTSVQDDFTLVAVEGNPHERWGALSLAPVEVQKGDRVNIIQHPGGGPKQISFFHNTVAYVGGGRVQYLTDTLPGSSGSPVLDKEWRVVALHHSGGMLSEPGGPSKAMVYRNEGIHINLVVAALRGQRAT